MKALHVNDAIASPVYDQVTERVIRQLFESLIYERVVKPRISENGDKLTFALIGSDERGETVEYRCSGRGAFTFGRIRIDRHSVVRCAGGEAKAAEHPRQLEKEEASQ